MSAHSGPNIDDTGLVFSYDAYNTDKSWKGAPTINLANEPNNIATIAASAGSIKTPNTIKLPAEVLKTSIGDMGDQIVGSGWIAWTNTGVTTGLQYMVSWYVKGYGTQNSIYWGWGGSHTGTKTTFEVSLTTGAITNLTLIPGETCAVKYIENGWWRISCSTTMTDTACYPQVSYTTGVYLCGIQIEQRSFLTPFVKGTRSNTQSLLDLTGRNTITSNSLTYNADGSFSFNGSSNYVSVSDSTSLQVADTFSISAWIYPTALNSRFGVFSTRTANDTGSWQLEVGAGSNGQNRVVVTGIGTWIFESSNDVIATNQWCNVCFVKPNNATQGGTMYVNGVPITPAVTTAYTILNNANSKTIGVGTSLLQNFPGNIGNIQLHNRALTAAEVLQNYSAINGRFVL